MATKREKSVSLGDVDVRGRIGREEYYFEIVKAVRKRSTCNRGKAGAIFVRDGRVLTTGYSGSPAGTPHCDEVGHQIMQKIIKEPHKDILTAFEEGKSSLHCMRTVHAEINAILQAAKFGISLKYSILYCWMFPCYECTKSLVNIGIGIIHSMYDYQDSIESKKMFDEVGIGYIIEEEKDIEYPPEKFR